MGPRRDSDGRYVKAGTTFELQRTLTGDIALGYVERSYEDAMLPRISGPTFDASLTWLASALTAVKVTARTTARARASGDGCSVRRRRTRLCPHWRAQGA